MDVFVDVTPGFVTGFRTVKAKKWTKILHAFNILRIKKIGMYFTKKYVRKYEKISKRTCWIKIDFLEINGA